MFSCDLVDEKELKRLTEEVDALFMFEHTLLIVSYLFQGKANQSNNSTQFSDTPDW